MMGSYDNVHVIAKKSKTFGSNLSSFCLFQCQVTVCLTDLLHNYAANEWPRYQEVGSSGGRPDDNSW